MCEIIITSLCKRLRELSKAVTQGPQAREREFTMSIPARPERDADLVLSMAAKLLEEQDALLKQNREEMAKMEDIAKNLVEASGAYRKTVNEVLDGMAR